MLGIGVVRFIDGMVDIDGIDECPADGMVDVVNGVVVV
jgi:hypothetical protein